MSSENWDQMDEAAPHLVQSGERPVEEDGDASGHSGDDKVASHNEEIHIEQQDKREHQAAPVSNGGSFLTEKLGPLPGYAWIALAAVAGLGGYAALDGSGHAQQQAPASAFTQSNASTPVNKFTPSAMPSMALGSSSAPSMAPVVTSGKPPIKPDTPVPVAVEVKPDLSASIEAENAKLKQRLELMTQDIASLQKQITRINGEIAVIAAPKPEAVAETRRKERAKAKAKAIKVWHVRVVKGWSVKSATTGGSALIVDRHGVTHLVEAGDVIDGIRIRFVGESHVVTSAGVVRFK